MYDIRSTQGPNPQHRYTLIEARPDANGEFVWIDRLHHDLDGALRSFRFLADKVRATYDPNDPRGQKVIASIDQHLRTIEDMKANIIDRIFPQVP